MHKYNFFTIENRVLRVASRRFAAHPRVPSHVRTTVRSFGQLAGRDVPCLQNQLDIEVQLRTNIEPDQMDQHEKGLALRRRRAIRQKLRELRITEGTQANANFALHVPDALSGYEVNAQRAASFS